MVLFIALHVRKILRQMHQIIKQGSYAKCIISYCKYHDVKTKHETDHIITATPDACAVVFNYKSSFCEFCIEGCL